jgi:hypothetical protein
VILAITSSSVIAIILSRGKTSCPHARTALGVEGQLRFHR